MRVILSNYGHRYLQHLARTGALDRAQVGGDVRLLGRILALGPMPANGSQEVAALEGRGLVARVGDEVDAPAAALRYGRNPLEHLRRVTFEYTTICNLDCLHCRNGNLEAEATADPARLRRVVDAALPIGLDRFHFIGGEVTLYGKGWLDLVAYIRAQGGAETAVITSGWFLGERDFLAAGRRYIDDCAYLDDLRSCGLTHVVFSLDGPEEVHDHCRQKPGLYRRVLEGVKKVRGAGLQPRFSLVAGMGTTRTESATWTAGLARLIYVDEADEAAALQRLLGDESGYVSNFIDVGSGVNLLRSGHADGMERFTDAELRCKNFFRPSPTLRIQSTGDIAMCPLIEGGRGYGNVFERDVVDILNNLQDAFLYKIHAERLVGSFRRFVDPGVFGHGLGHVCSARVALNMVAQAMVERDVEPGDDKAIRAINVEVAEKMGVRPRTLRHRANGNVRPR
jgi:MoaA/NifB/PqqE/SkfB family radical SAM enzyme